MAEVALKTPSSYVIKSIERSAKAIQKIETNVENLVERAEQARRDAIGQAVYAIADEWPGARGPAGVRVKRRWVHVPWCWACDPNESGRQYVVVLGGRLIGAACGAYYLASDDPTHYDCIGSVADMTIYRLRPSMEVI